MELPNEWRYAIEHSEQSDLRVPDPGFWNDGERLLSADAASLRRGVFRRSKCSAVAQALSEM